MSATLNGGRGLHPLGAYVAKRCPVRLQWDVHSPGERQEEIVNELRTGQGNEFEEAITQEAMASQPEGWVRIERDDRERAEIAKDTLTAMADGALVIFDGRLPIDEDGFRVGEPDVLVRHGDQPVDGTWRYLPVDVKHHLTLSALADNDSGESALVSTLESPFLCLLYTSDAADE